MRSTRELREKTTTDEEMTQLAINTIRTLAIDAVQQGRSEHPGYSNDARSADCTFV